MRTLTSLLVVSSLAIGASALAQPAPAPAPASGSDAAAGSGSGSDAIDPASVSPADMPTAIRLRRLEQKTQALKERAWQLKSRVQLLKEQLVGGGVGAQALIAHVSEMTSSFRLTKLVYTLDGTQVFVRADETAEDIYKTRMFDIFAGPISPGNHTLVIAATYRGHGYGVFDYLSKYTFTAHGNATFVAGEGKVTKVDCRGYEKGGATTPLEKRPSVECKVTQQSPDTAADDAASSVPRGSTNAAPRGEVTMGRAAMMRRLSLVLALTAGTAFADVDSKLTQYAQEAHQLSQTLPVLDDSTKAPPSRRLVDAQVAFSLGDYDDAAVILFDLTGLVGPEQEAASYYLAETLYAKGDKGASRAYYQQIVEKNAPGSRYYQPSLLRLIDIAIAQNDPSDVDATLAAIDRARPPIANAAYVKAKWAFSQGRYDDAIRQFAEVPKGSTFETQAVYYTATGYVAKGELPKAVELFTLISNHPLVTANDRRVIELAQLALGRLYYERDELSKSIDSYLRIDRNSDLFPEAVYEVAWVYVKNKQYDKALHALELLALSNPNSNRTATVRLLEGNLRIRKAQLNRTAQIENTIDAKTVDPAVEYEKANAIFTETHDEFYAGFTAIETMMADKVDPADYLAQLAGREASVFQASSPLPDAVLQYLREEDEPQRIIENQVDLGAIKAHLTESQDTVERLELVIGTNDKSILYPAMQSKRERIATMQRDLITIRNDLAEQQLQFISSDASLSQLSTTRRSLFAAFSTGANGEVAHSERVDSERGAYDALSAKGAEIRTAIDQTQAMAVTIRAVINQKPQGGAAPVSDEVRASANTELIATAGELAALESELRDLKAEVALGRDLAGVHDEGLAPAIAQRHAVKAAEDAEQHALDATAGSSRDAGRMRKLVEQADTAMRISDDLAATETKIDQAIDKALAEAKDLLAKERANVDSYKQELDQYELESRAIGSTILGASFANVKAKFYDVVVRTDVGTIDVSWSQKEDADDDLKRLNLSRAREMKLMIDEFRDILEPSQMQIPTQPVEKQEPTSATPSPTPTPPTAGSPDKGANERVKSGDDKAAPVAPTVRPDSQQSQKQSQKQPQKTTPTKAMQLPKTTAPKGATK